MRAHSVPNTDSDMMQHMSEEKTSVERCQVLCNYKEHLTLREVVGTVLLSEHLLALLSNCAFDTSKYPPKERSGNSPSCHKAKVIVVCDFHPYESFDLATGESCFSRNFVL